MRMYIVLPTTSGADSCPRKTPVENVKRVCKRATLSREISARPLKRVLASSLAGVRHEPSSGNSPPATGSGVSSPLCVFSRSS